MKKPHALSHLVTTGLLLAVLGLPALAQTGQLNDTGQTSCYNAANAAVACDAATMGNTGTRPHQDPRYGRDPAALMGQATKTGGGAAGFDYTRICWNGSPEGTVGGANPCTGTLVANTTGTASANPTSDWACTKDNITGLVWSLQSQNTSWTNANSASYPDAGHNSANRCGAGADWRLPTRRELLGIVHHGATPGSAAVDLNYLPNTASATHWSADLTAADLSKAWLIDFSAGAGTLGDKTTNATVRLVRSIAGGGTAAVPTVETARASQSYTTTGGNGTNLAPYLQVDSTPTTLLGAKVQITGNFTSADDLLQVDALAGVSNSYNATNGTLTLTGGASVAQYVNVLKSVRYVNSSRDPLPNSRQFLVSATNASGESADTTAARTSVDLSNVCPLDQPTKPVLVVDESFGTDGAQIVQLDRSQCVDANNEGCRLPFALQGNDGEHTFTTEAVDTPTIEPRQCLAGDPGPTYHWEIFFPTANGGAKYTSAGISGYFAPTLTIQPSSLPSLAGGLWRVVLTVQQPARHGVPGATLVKKFRFEYQNSILTMSMSTNCQSPLTELNSQCTVPAGLPVPAGTPS